jgi:hypothetical protein
MKATLISTLLFIVAICVIPVGGMSESNANCKIYMYSFLFCEVLCIVSIIRYIIKIRQK